MRRQSFEWRPFEWRPFEWRSLLGSLGSNPASSWPFARGQYSLQLSRTLSILAFLALAATDILALFTGTQSLRKTDPVSSATIATLLFLPLMGAIGALGALAFQGVSKGFRLPTHKGAWVSFEVLERWFGLVCRVSGFAILALYAFTLALGPLLTPNVLIPTSQFASHQSFILSYAMVAAVLAAALLPEILRFSYIIMMYPLGLHFQLHLLGSISTEVIEGPTSLLTFNLAICCGITWLGFRARELDKATTARDMKEREIAYEKAFQTARRHADSYIHDNVLSALTPAISGLADTKYLRQAVGNALYSLSMLDNSHGHTARTPATLFSKIKTNALRRDPRLVVSEDYNAKSAELNIPETVSEALQSATMEALNNSLRHAAHANGTPIKRTLAMRASNDAEIAVIVQDDGDIHRQSHDIMARTENHGVRVSIIGRMRDVGGHASVDFGDSNTIVTITWRRNLEAPAVDNHAPIKHPVIARAAQSRSARAMAAWATLSTLVILLCETPNYTTLVWPLIALTWQAGATTLLLWEWPEALMPRWAQVTVILTVGLSNLLVLFSISANGYPDYAAWTLGTGWLMSLGLLVRCGNIRAWSAMALLGISTWGWTLLSHRTPMIALTLVAGQVIPLMLNSLLVVWFKYLTSYITQIRQDLRFLENQEITLRETTRQLDDRLGRIARRAEPILEQIASANTLSPEMQVSARLLEGELRDEIRAPGLGSTNLLHAVANARRRGVEVVLLDDRASAPLSDSALTKVENQAVEILEQTTSGRVVVRLLPPGRSQLATVVAPNVRWALPAS